MTAGAPWAGEDSAQCVDHLDASGRRSVDPVPLREVSRRRGAPRHRGEAVSQGSQGSQGAQGSQGSQGAQGASQ